VTRKPNARQSSSKTLRKALTGIQGLDEITGGGLPRGRPTLVSGGAGSGKTLFGLEFLVRGATQYDEPGVFMSFEETIPDLTVNAASLGFDLGRLVADKKLFIDHVHVSRNEGGATGEYDLDGLFIRIADAAQRVGAKRIVLDTIEALFSELPNPTVLRAELHRLFGWLKDKGLTTVITAERDGPDKLTRHGIEEFVSDCVIVLDHRLGKRFRPGACASSSTADRPTGPTSIRSSSTSTASPSCRSPRSAWTMPRRRHASRPALPGWTAC
jgi:circadian clock protein KaiC